MSSWAAGSKKASVDHIGYYNLLHYEFGLLDTIAKKRTLVFSNRAMADGIFKSERKK